MPRRSLRPQLNQIRAWVRQGRTDAWIAHQLEVSASELREFRRQHDLTADDEGGNGDIDLRDEIEAEIEAATAGEDEQEPEDEDEDEDEDEQEDDESRIGRGEEDAADQGDAEGEDEAEGGPAGDGADARPRRRRRRGRRGGRGRRRSELEATFDHGESDGYGLWIDPAVKEDPNYSEHWAGHRAVTVTVEPDQIVIRRTGGAAAATGDEGEGSEER